MSGGRGGVGEGEGGGGGRAIDQSTWAASTIHNVD